MTLIIAEVGSNFLGLQDCLDSIVAAKVAGADCVKFQLYTHKELYGYDGKMAGELPREWVPQLHVKCQEVGIEFMCTAFSPEGYRFIDPYVKRHKIASAETTDWDIVRAVASIGKPAIISTGGSTPDEIDKVLNSFAKDMVSLLFCVSAYPAKRVDLSNIRLLSQRFTKRLPVKEIGYSCHTAGIADAITAVNYGATVIEKHFKVRDMKTPDNGHSVLPQDFKKMVDEIRDRDQQVYAMDDDPDFIKYSKRRWVPELNGYYRTKPSTK